jgi:hypothetical protein
MLLPSLSNSVAGTCSTCLASEQRRAATNGQYFGANAICLETTAAAPCHFPTQAFYRIEDITINILQRMKDTSLVSAFGHSSANSFGILMPSSINRTSTASRTCFRHPGLSQFGQG